jgi:aspartate/methionine/tyrosine aminotransferase
MFKNITEHEIIRLPADFNLTDGHAYRRWSPDEAKIIDKAAEHFKSINRQMQFDLEKEYVSLFLTLGKQSVNFDAHNYLLCTTASMGMEIIANYLRLNNYNLCLIEPCFDNLADICKRHNIQLESFPDEALDSADFTYLLDSVHSQAICLITPNNPTGNVLTKDNFLALINYCSRTNKLLILDCAFRAYTPEEQVFDQYDILSKSGVHYILIEDTGKTWPTAELKAPFLAVSAALYKAIYDIYTDFLLHASPFVIKLMIEFIKLSISENLSYTHYIVNVNRKALYENIYGSFLTPVEKPHSSVSWLRVNGMTGFELKQILDERGLYIIPGDYFYWSTPQKGSQFIRVALVRDPDVFSRAATLLGEICRELDKK